MVERGETTERRVTDGGATWRATVAWRARDGSSLCYFRPEGEAGDGLADRRARLPAGRSLADLDEAELAELLEASTALTATERRFRAPDGRDWLAQNIGPVWAEDEAAEGATGVLFTALDGGADRLRTGGGHVGRMSGQALESAWRRAGGDSGEDDGEGRGDGPGETDGDGG